MHHALRACVTSHPREKQTAEAHAHGGAGHVVTITPAGRRQLRTSLQLEQHMPCLAIEACEGPLHCSWGLGNVRACDRQGRSAARLVPFPAHTEQWGSACTAAAGAPHKWWHTPCPHDTTAGRPCRQPGCMACTSARTGLSVRTEQSQFQSLKPQVSLPLATPSPRQVGPLLLLEGKV